ncbi:MAG: glycogen/starch synthase [Kofleriaceae bacterium]
MKDTLVMIMAGGKGSRLGPLTVHRSKPAVPFSGRYRIIDFVLSNFINSGYRRIYVLTQYMSSSLIKHLGRNWRLSGFGEYIEVVPAQMRMGEFWYRGTADAVYQNLNLLRDSRAGVVAVFGGDHVYKFAIDQMDTQHRDTGADLTVACIPVPRSEASAFGCIDVDARGRVVGFVEKPADPPELPDRPGWTLVSMGNYLFGRRGARVAPPAAATLRHRLRHTTSSRLAGPRRASRSPTTRAVVRRRRPEAPVADAASVRRCELLPPSTWRCAPGCRCSTSTTGSGASAAPSATTRRRGSCVPARRSVRPRSTTASSARARSCLGQALSDVVLGYDCFGHGGAEVTSSVILSGCDLGARSRLRRCILDKNCRSSPAASSAKVEADRAVPVRHRDRHRGDAQGHSGASAEPVVLANDVVRLLGNDPELRAAPARLVRGLDPAPPQLRIRRPPLQALRRRRAGRLNEAVRILHVSSEVAPWAQTGGLGDVARALPAAQARASVADVIAPAYARSTPPCPAGRAPWQPLTVGTHTLTVRLLVSDVAPEIGWLDCPALYDRDGMYGPHGGDFADNALRFAALCHGALALAEPLLGGAPDVVHGHDWQGALAVYLARGQAATVQTIHNLAFRGLFPKHTVDELGLPWRDFHPAGFEFWDQLSLLKAGLTSAGCVTTVSPSYAAEILEPPGDEGLGGCLRYDVARLLGIVNGIDLVAWDPATDAALPAHFSADSPDGKARCTAALRAEIGLPPAADGALMVVVSRLSAHKGTDLIADLVPSLPELGAQLVVLGSGDPALEERLLALAAAYPQHLAVRIGFDVALARRMYGGGELFLMPSRFEPCGLGQLYAMRYGAVPVVRTVGGLRDTVDDPYPDPAEGSGFRFDHPDLGGLRWAVTRALDERRAAPARFAARRTRGMRRRSGWHDSAARYLAEYRRLLAERQRGDAKVDAGSATGHR